MESQKKRSAWQTAGCGLLLLSTGGWALAQQPVAPQQVEPVPQVQAPGDRTGPPQTIAPREGAEPREAEYRGEQAARQAMVRRASKIMGLEVRNAEGEELGNVNDLVIDGRQGKVEYAALSFGGFLGVGDKLFAVPWNAFEVTARDGEQVLMLNIEEEKLKQAPGFDKENWPDTASQDWRNQIDMFYRPAGDDQPAAVPAEEARETTSTVDANPLIFRASELQGMDVHNPQHEKVADINDLVIDMTDGNVRYAALSFGGFLGLGDKLFAVPWQAFQVMVDEDGDPFLVFNVTEQQLENAQGFNQEQWPNVADPRWQQEADAQFPTQQQPTVNPQEQPAVTPQEQPAVAPQQKPAATPQQ